MPALSTAVTMLTALVIVCFAWAAVPGELLIVHFDLCFKPLSIVEGSHIIRILEGD